MINLALCPFCGVKPDEATTKMNRISCRNRECPIFTHGILVRDWNCRPKARRIVHPTKIKKKNPSKRVEYPKNVNGFPIIPKRSGRIKI